MRLSRTGAFNSVSNMKLVFVFVAVFWTLLLIVLAFLSYHDTCSSAHLAQHAIVMAIGLVSIYISYRYASRSASLGRLIEDELEYAESNLARAELIAGFGNWEFDLDQGVVDASMGARTIYGLIEGPITIEQARQIPLPEYRALLDEAFQNLIRDNIPYDMEFKIRRPNDGAIRDIHSVASYNSSNNRLFGVIHDITERKRIEESLRESEQKFRSYVRYAPDGVFVADANGDYHEVNDAACKFTGYEREELLRMNFIDLIAPEDRERAFRHFSKAKDTGYASGDLRFVRKDGSIRWWTVNGAFVKQNLLLGFVRDITEFKEKEKALIESEEKYRFMLENIEDVIWRQDPDLTFNYISPSDKKQRGYEAEDVIGRKIWDFLTPASIEHVRSRFSERLKYLDQYRHLGSAVYEVEQYRKDGSTIWTEMISNPILDSEGTLVGFQGVTRDITDRKKAEDERLEMERRLLHAQKLESLGVLSGGIAHDFNNLLTVILGNLEIALMDIGTRNSARFNIEKAVKAAKRSADLTRQMLAYSGKGAFVIRDMDLSKLIDEYAQMFRTVVSRNVEIQLSLDHNLPSIRADIGQIQQVVMNLMSNASEAIGSQPGLVTVSTGVVDCDEKLLEKSLLVQKPAPGRFVRLEVTDTGCGMDEETLSRLFDPFFSTKFVGKGLGMSAVLGIVRGHGGAIMVDTCIDWGTKIEVLFPSTESFIQEDSATEVKPASLPIVTSNGADPPTILIVDDETEISELTSNSLKSVGYRTIQASNGKEALRIFREAPESFDLVVIDLTMPDMNGAQAFYEMKAINPNVKIIVCSGYSKEEVASKFNDFMPRNIVQKPFEQEALKRQIELLLKKPSNH